jgi:hypothetical protein
MGKRRKKSKEKGPPHTQNGTIYKGAGFEMRNGKLIPAHAHDSLATDKMEKV